jgi:predicted ribosome quality control (RQC) complex YloA/Tae2 family protein
MMCFWWNARKMKNTKIKEIVKKSKVHIDKKLNEYENKILFLEKLAKANKMLKNVALPKEIIAQ